MTGAADGRGGFRHLEDVVRYEGAFLRVVSGRFATPDGAVFERDVVRHPGAVVVVPLVDDDVVMVRQYRAALDALVLEVPAGKRDVADEPPEVTARRELLEEVGYEADRLDRLALVHPTPGFCDEEMHVFAARGLRQATPDRQGVEEQHMTTERVPLAAVRGLVAAGQVTDAKTIIGCLLAADAPLP